MGIQLEASTAGGRRPLDTEINLIPMIDLLIVSITFLLLTAVWTQLSRLAVTQQMPGPPDIQAPSPVKTPPTLRVTEQGYLLVLPMGETQAIDLKQGAYDNAQLGQQLDDVHKAAPDNQRLIVTPEDGVRYRDVIAAMDVALQSGFGELSIADGTEL